ncbi:MAG: DUF4124 domain-containing protein [Candidatus Riflebacteria bacterium]|jgi:hypothetical protein|nr:DUF4124 domain-containing protein [Candidatus Riflebacteria bacterium]
MRRPLILLAVVIALVFSASMVPVFAATSLTTTYTVITEYGLIASFPANLAPGEKLVKSGDNLHAYRVKTVPVRDESHLLQLMGAASEAELTDLQKGLLESHRFAVSNSFDNLKTRVPGTSPGINLELVDITGYTDTSRFTTIKEDFWPQNSRVYKYSDGGYDLHSDIRISGTDCLGYGTETARTMQSTFAHEFGHALDKTFTEADAYGPDGAHYINEKIETKASFAEGFANFIMMLFFPEKEPEFRESIRTIKIERPEGGYDEFPIADARLAGEGYFDVEAINTLIFTRLAAELPDGRRLVLDSFQKHNQRDNRMGMFLKNFVSDYPEHAEAAARILDRETLGKLSDAEMRQILGSSRGIEKFISSRAVNEQVSDSSPAENTGSPGHKPGTIYKWKDAAGNWQFTDQPPPQGVEYTTRSRAAEPGKASPVTIENPDASPFIIGY